jgi:hypothetical protein
MSRTAKYVAGLGLLAVSTAAFGVLIAAPSLLPAKVALDPKTLCPTTSQVAGHTIVLIDRTDPFTDSQLARIRQTIARVRAGLAVHARLSIHLLTADPTAAATPVFDLCNPGDGSTIDPLTGNPRRAQERYQTEFGAPLDRVLTELATPQDAPRSPIIEAVAQLGWATDFSPNTPNRRLVVVSDLLQNTADASFYRRIPDIEDVLRSPAGRRLLAAGFKGMRIELVRLRNPEAALHRGPNVLAFWLQLLRSAGAEVTVAGSARQTAARK